MKTIRLHIHFVIENKWVHTASDMNLKMKDFFSILFQMMNQESSEMIILNRDHDVIDMEKDMEENYLVDGDVLYVYLLDSLCQS